GETDELTTEGAQAARVGVEIPPAVEQNQCAHTQDDQGEQGCQRIKPHGDVQVDGRHPVIVEEELTPTAERSLDELIGHPEESGCGYQRQHTEGGPSQSPDQQWGQHRGGSECEKKYQHAISVPLWSRMWT